VAPPVRIQWLEGGEAVDLVQALAVRGLVGKPLRRGNRHAVVVHDPHEEADRLVAELVAALESWLSDRGRESLEVTLGDRSRTVSARPDLPNALRGRLAPGRGTSSKPVSRPG
jgi:hypothetical protein